jgi:hypothetical protein
MSGYIIDIDYDPLVYFESKDLEIIICCSFTSFTANTSSRKMNFYLQDYQISGNHLGQMSCNNIGITIISGLLI